MKFFKFSTWLMAMSFAFASLQKVQAETVAKIEDVDYSSLQSAVAACWEGQTVVMMSDVDLGSDENAKIYLNHGQCRLDLNGRTISASFAAGPMVISVNEGTSLTICDRKGGGAIINTSTFNSIWNSVLNADNGGLIRVEGGSFVYGGPASGGGLFYDEGGAFEVAGGTFNADPTAYLVSGCTVRKAGDATWSVPAAPATVSPAAAVKVAGALSYEKVTIRTMAALQDLCATEQVFIDAWENDFPQDSAPHYLSVSDTTVYYVEYYPGYGEYMSAKGLVDDSYEYYGDTGINLLNNHGFYKGVPGGEENKCYPTLAEAVAAVDVGQTIVLFGDNDERVSGGTVPFMLQLNGYTYDKTRFAPAAGWMLKTESDELMSYRELGSAVARVVSADGSVTNDYETLAEAVATLKAGWTVTLLADCDETVDGRVMPFVLEKGGWAFSGEIMPADGFKVVESPIAGDDSVRYLRQDEDPVLTAGMKKVASGFYQNAEKYLNATNFYITSRDGLAFFRGLVNGEDPAISAYIAAKCYGNDKKGFYTNNIFSRKTVVLLSDADLDDELWTPIGAYDAIKHGANYEKAYFYGNFDGGQHAVRNLKVSGTNTVTKGFYAGFFGYVQVNPSATNLISNLMLENVDISGFDYVGGIAGAANQTAGRTVISNCHVIGSISICSRSSFLGGIVGHGYGSVYDCSVVSSDGRGVIHAGGQGIRVGGIVGHNESPSCRIENCLVAGIDISMDYKYLIGGIAGTVFRGAVIRNCEVGDVRINCDASPYFGLIAGRTDGQSGVAVIEDCRVVNSTAFGRAGGAPVQCFTQNGEHANNETYSIVGSNIVWQSDGLVAGGVFENIAEDYIAEGYEKVSLGTVNPETWEVREVVSASVAEVISADGTVTNGYPTLAEAFANAVSADDPANGSTVRMLEDIDLAGVEWSPVDFRGTFDGNGKTISNLKVSGTMDTVWAGFFSYFRGSARDVTFVGADISGNRCGVFAAMVSNSGPGNDNLVMTFDNIRVLDSKITGFQKCGGLIGFFADSNGSAFIRNCTVDGLQLVNIDAEGIWQSAGLVGYLQPLGHEDVTFTGNTVKDVVCSLDGNSAGYVRSYASGVFIGRLENESDADRQHGETGYGTVILTGNRIEGTNTGFAVGPKTNDYIGDYITVDEIGSTFGGVKAVDVLKVEIDGVDITIPKAASVAEVISADGTVTNGFETIAAAIEAAQDGETVRLLADAELEEPILIEKSIVLDGNGCVLTGSALNTSGTDRATIAIEGVVEVVVKDLTVDKNSTVFDVAGTAVNLTLSGVTGYAFRQGVNLVDGYAGTLTLADTRLFALADGATYITPNCGKQLETLYSKLTDLDAVSPNEGKMEYDHYTFVYGGGVGIRGTVFGAKIALENGSEVKGWWEAVLVEGSGAEVTMADSEVVGYNGVEISAADSSLSMSGSLVRGVGDELSSGFGCALAAFAPGVTFALSSSTVATYRSAMGRTRTNYPSAIYTELNAFADKGLVLRDVRFVHEDGYAHTQVLRYYNGTTETRYADKVRITPEISNFATEPDAGLPLCVAPSYALVYNLGTEGCPEGAEMPGDAPQSYTPEGCVLPKPVYESTEVTFGGWLTNGATTAIMAIPAGTTGDLTLKAKWDALAKETFYVKVAESVEKKDDPQLTDIRLTQAWVDNPDNVDPKEYSAAQSEEDKVTIVQEALNTVAPNGNLKWQNYVLGLSDATKVEAGAEQSPNGEVVQVESKFVVPPPDTGYKVEYALDKVEKGADTGEEIGARSETKQVLIPVDEVLQGDAKVGYAKLKAVLVPESGGGQESVVPAGNTIGIMKVESDLEKTIIPVPWGELGGGEIRVSNLIQVSNLTPGDRIYVYTIKEDVPYDASKFESWELTAAYAWQKIPVITLNEDGQQTDDTGKESDDPPVYRGQGVWLERQKTDKPIILSGQYNGDLATTPVHGTTEAPVHNIVASPNAEMDVDLNEVAANAGEDTVFLPTKGAPRVYSFRNGSWGYVGTELTTRGGKSVEVPVWKPDSKIKSSDGFWYIGRGGRSNLDWKQTK